MRGLAAMFRLPLYLPNLITVGAVNPAGYETSFTCDTVVVDADATWKATFLGSAAEVVGNV
jgi:hypothetical protein